MQLSSNKIVVEIRRWSSVISDTKNRTNYKLNNVNKMLQQHKHRIRQDWIGSSSSGKVTALVDCGPYDAVSTIRPCDWQNVRTCVGPDGRCPPLPGRPPTRRRDAIGRRRPLPAPPLARPPSHIHLSLGQRFSLSPTPVEFTRDVLEVLPRPTCLRRGTSSFRTVMFVGCTGFWTTFWAVWELNTCFIRYVFWIL